MPSLKNLRIRIQSVVSTRKITSAMKMVAASKLRRAQEQAEMSKPYVEAMQALVHDLITARGELEVIPDLLQIPEKDHTELVIVATSDRGLCGNFNGSIIRGAKKHIATLLATGKNVKIMCVGKKAYDQMNRQYAAHIVHTVDGLSKKKISIDDALAISAYMMDIYAKGEITSATLIHNTFKSAITSIVTTLPLIPLLGGMQAANQNGTHEPQTMILSEPDAETLLEDLLPRMVATQILNALLNNNASEHAARMTAMDNATRNASDMIAGLKLNYNRTRQAFITKELTEIVSGAEAL